MNKILLEIVLILGVSVAANLGYSFWKNHQQKIGYDRRNIELAIEIANKNVTVIEKRKQVRHENQNRDRDALLKYGCKRGWVRELERCAALR